MQQSPSSSEEIKSDEQNREMRFRSLEPHFKKTGKVARDLESEGNILTSHNNETHLDEKLSRLENRKELKRYLQDIKKRVQQCEIQSPERQTPKISLLEALNNTPSEHIDNLDQSSQSQLSIKPDKESSYLSVNFQERKRRQSSSSSFLSVNFRKHTEKDSSDHPLPKPVCDFRNYRNAQRKSQQKLTYQDKTQQEKIERRKSRLSSQDQLSSKDLQIESNLYNIRRKKQLNVTSITPTQPPPQFQQGSLLHQIQSAQKIYSQQHPEEPLLHQVANRRKNSQNSNPSTPRGILKNSSQESSLKSVASKLSVVSNSPGKRVKFGLTKKQAKQKAHQ